MEFGDFSMAPSSSEVELDKKLYTMLDLEAKRYKNFFGTLDEHQHKLLPRDVVLAFYGKSALSEHVRPCVQRLLRCVMSLGRRTFWC